MRYSAALEIKLPNMSKDRTKIIGLRLRQIRDHVGISRKRLSGLCNIPDNTIRAWEAGQTDIGVARLCEYLEIFQDFDFYVDINSLINPSSNFQTDFEQALQKSRQISVWLQNITQTNVLFYLQADGLVVYFNPKYKYIIGDSLLQRGVFMTFTLTDLFNSDYYHEILSSRVKTRIINITRTPDNLPIELKVELHYNLDSYNNLIGVTGFVLPKPNEPLEENII